MANDGTDGSKGPRLRALECSKGSIRARAGTAYSPAIGERRLSANRFGSKKGTSASPSALEAE
jgi:hypothetical protein